jgi:hypothetical protein
MAAKPLDIRIIKGDTRKPNYLINYLQFHFPLLIKLQTFFPLSFLYSVSADASEPPVAGIAVCSFRYI